MMPRRKPGRHRRASASPLLVVVIAVAVVGCGGEGRGEPRSLPVGPEGTAPSAPGTPQADSLGPHEVENNRWRQRRELSASDRRLAEEGAVRVRSALDQLRADNEFSVEAVTETLIGLGYDRSVVQVRPFATPPGAVYAVRVGEAGCIHGDLRPGRVLVEVAGPSPESGCIEPP